MTERRSVTVETLAAVLLQVHSRGKPAEAGTPRGDWQRAVNAEDAALIFAALPAEPTEPAGALDVALRRMDEAEAHNRKRGEEARRLRSGEGVQKWVRYEAQADCFKACAQWVREARLTEGASE